MVAGLCFFWMALPAHAEKWVSVFNDDKNEMFADVDVDSIRKGDDGLVYFNDRTDIGSNAAAVDCQKRILYKVDGYMGEKENPNWKSKGNKVVPDSNGSKILDFVCSHAK